MKSSSTSNPSKGLHLDTTPKHQPPSTYRYALNAVNESSSGNHLYLTNELGNELCGKIPKPVVGHVLLDNKDILLACYPDEIGIYSPASCFYTPLIEASCLNFQLDKRVYMIYRMRNGCDRTVYLTDNHNDYRVINLDNLPSPFTCDAIKYSRDFSIPSLSLVNVSQGGSLKLGTYQFAIRYLDSSYNPTNWVLISTSVPVVDDSKSAGFAQFDGGVNTVDNTTIVGQTTSNKKITLQIDNLDPDFDYYEIAILSYVSDSGTLTSCNKTGPIPSSKTSFRHLGTESYDSIPIDDILVDDVVVKTVATHAQLDNRLYLGNVTEYSQDYSTYQKYASKITTEWVAKDAVDTLNHNDRRNSKNEHYYFDNVGFQSDEIYAFGIVYVHANGTKSPVFHIPGRCPTLADLVVLPSHDSDIFNAAKNKKWQVHNTASVTQTDPTTGRGVRGLFGYYQTTTTYPQVSTCSNPDDYWGQACDGTKLTGKPIRHHRFPTWDIVANLDNPTCGGPDSILGVQFSGVTYPNSEVVSHYFVFSDRAQEFTVYDTAYVTHPLRKTIQGVVEYQYKPSKLWDITIPAPDSVLNLYSTKVWLDGDIDKVDYLRFTKIIKKRATEGAVTLKNVRQLKYDGEIDIEDGRIWNFAYYCFPSDLAKPTSYNFKLRDITIASPTEDYDDAQHTARTLNTISNSAANVKNFSTVNSSCFIALERQADLLSYNANPADPYYNIWAYAYLKYDRDVFEDLSTIQYVNANNIPAQDITYRGDAFNSTINFLDYHWARETGTPNTVDVYPLSLNLSFQTSRNVSLRHGDKEDPQYYYYKYDPSKSPNDSAKDLAKYLGAKVYFDDGDTDLETPHMYDEVYLYNKDYSVYASPQRLSSLPVKYDYCNECSGKHPYRIYYSQLDDQEGLEDNYRKILPLSYRDLDGSQGPISALVNNFSNLYALTTHTTYFIPTRPQSLGTNEGAIYIGTGEVLSLPPRQLKVTNYEYGGTSHQSSITQCEYGTLFIDDYSGTPFLLTNELVSLADGLRNYFEENAPLKLVNYLNSLGLSYPHKVPTAGLGYTTCYDPRHKRLIVHKKDYLPTVTVSHGNLGGELTLNSRGEFINTKKKVIPIGDPAYFKDMSYTLSYSFITSSWVSHHSYFPTYLLNNYETFFSQPSTGLWKHGKGKYQTFYGLKHDHVIEATLNEDASVSKVFDSVIYESEASINSSYSDVTFDRFVAYNDRQTSSLLTLVPANLFSTNASSTTTSLLRKKDNYYRISDFRDLSINDQAAFIDESPNLSKVDLNKSLFTAQRLRDYYMRLRLYFKPMEDIKISTDLASVTTRPNTL